MKLEDSGGKKKKKKSSHGPSTALRSVCISPSADQVAVGYNCGWVQVFDYPSWKESALLKKRKEWVSEMRYSPDGKFLAVGTHDNFVDIYNVRLRLSLSLSLCLPVSTYH